MNYLLDTNAVIALLKGNPSFHDRLRTHHPGDFALSSIVVHELYFGAYRSKRVAENLHKIRGLQFQILEFDEDDAQRSGEIRAELCKFGLPIGPYDVLIAGQASSRNLTLLTSNMREFERVSNLRVEDWIN